MSPFYDCSPLIAVRRPLKTRGHSIYGSIKVFQARDKAGFFAKQQGALLSCWQKGVKFAGATPFALKNLLDV